ncbi:MAG: Rieske (2Fe-2S) protein [Polyangiaceae bacterium]
MIDEKTKIIGRIPLAHLAEGRLVRLAYPPYDVLVSLVRGIPCAIEDACNHAGASLSEGDRSEECVTCPMHGYIFELATGRLVEPARLCESQRAFVAWIEGSDVIVSDPGADVIVVGA